MLQPLAEEQARRNRAANDCWDLYAEHREHVMRHLLADVPPEQGGTLCVLGAGNCNDLDLARLSEFFDTIHLVDWDGAAIASGAARQLGASNRTIQLHGDVELTGVGDQLAALSSAAPASSADVAGCIEQASQASQFLLPDPADVVASVCTLSQLIETAIRCLGEQHPDTFALVQAVRQGHLHTIFELLKPGGRAVLITDFVSSETCPELIAADVAQLPSLVMNLIREHNFFTGVNPFAVAAAIHRDALLSGRIDRIEVSPPWKWQYPARTYAVTAIRFRRASS